MWGLGKLVGPNREGTMPRLVLFILFFLSSKPGQTGRRKRLRALGFWWLGDNDGGNRMYPMTMVSGGWRLAQSMTRAAET